MSKELKTDSVIVRIPVDVLEKIVSCAGSDCLKLLSSNFAVVSVRNEDHYYNVVGFDDRESAVAEAAKIAWSKDYELVYVLKGGVPRNYKVDLNVRFR